MEKEIHVQVKDNSPSMERILRPISYASWFLGVGVAHPRKCPKAITIIIRIIHMTVCFISVIYEASDIFPYIHELDIFEYVYCLNKVMCYVSAYYYIYHGIRQYNKWLELMDRLKELDQKMKKEISMNDRSIKIVVALAVFATFTPYPLILIFTSLYYYCFQTHIRYLVVIGGSDLRLYYMLCQSLINSFVFDVIVYVLYCRFQTVNKLIGQVDKSSDVLWIALKIRNIRKLHTDICDLVNMVHDIHSLHLLFCLANCFTVALDVLFKVYIYDMDHKDYEFTLLQNFCFIAYVTQFYLICWVCTLACQESNRTGKIIYIIILNYKSANLDNHEASNLSNLEMRPLLEDLGGQQEFSRNHNLRYNIKENLLRGNLDQECVTKEINDFSIQLQQNRIAFTACNFFEINNALFTTFVEVIITYLVVVSQLYKQPKDVSMLKKLILKMTKKNQTYSQN
ncbi:uncharacterized protein LOC105193243 [Solenopsis invicta]|uniref:uncharacterized protein LOC105193243 n=1 Tax=Solenopsis invicta TaxID=13686 RepID=UPI00193DBB32|nr:uncharacterized protein LOC105193243 [Solenopsis invicta]